MSEQDEPIPFGAWRPGDDDGGDPEERGRRLLRLQEAEAQRAAAQDAWVRSQREREAALAEAQEARAAAWDAQALGRAERREALDARWEAMHERQTAALEAIATELRALRRLLAKRTAG